MNSSAYSTSELNTLFEDAIVKLGIGGHVSTAEILRYFNPMTAEQFAEIAYATDLMDSIYVDPTEAKNAANIDGFVKENNFRLKPCFIQLVKMFNIKFEGHGPFTFE